MTKTKSGVATKKPKTAAAAPPVGPVVPYVAKYNSQDFLLALAATAMSSHTYNVSLTVGFRKDHDASRMKFLLKNGLDGSTAEQLLEIGPDQLLGRETHGWYISSDGYLRNTEISHAKVNWVRETHMHDQTLRAPRYMVELEDGTMTLLFRTAKEAAQHHKRELRVAF